MTRHPHRLVSLLCTTAVMLLTRPSGATSTAGQARIQDWRLELSASGEVAASHLPQSAPGYMGPRLEPDLWQGFAKLPARVQVN